MHTHAHPVNLVSPAASSGRYKECGHGIGHSIFYSVALDMPGLWDRLAPPCSVLQPHGETVAIDRNRLSQGHRMCRGAPTTMLAKLCCEGFYHSYSLYQKAEAADVLGDAFSSSECVLTSIGEASQTYDVSTSPPDRAMDIGSKH